MAIIHLIKQIIYNPYFYIVLAMIACWCFNYLKNNNNSYKNIIWIGYSLIFAFILKVFIQKVLYGIHHPEVWDYTAFFLYGKVAASGYNFYLPENFQIVFNSLHLPFTDFQGFVEEVVNVGFPYPPPTMFYFIPLGYLSFETAKVVWTIFNLIFVVGSVYLIFDLFFKPYKLNGLILVCSLLLIFWQSFETIRVSQTNFIVLFWLLLMKKYSEKGISGIFLTFAFFTKPYMIIFGLYFLLRKKWKPIIYAVISAIGILGVTLITFGKDPFLSYLFDNPVHRLPEYVFHEGGYQSLYSTIIKGNWIIPLTPALYLSIVFTLFLGIIYYLIYLLKQKLYDYIWAILLLFGLLIYPGMLNHYGVLLLFIVFQFFEEKKQLGYTIHLIIPLIGIIYFLSIFSVFTSVCFILGILIIKSTTGLSQISTLAKDA